MLKKRLIGVITVKDGWAVQSFSYRRYLPLGHPEVLAENLDRWGADEILLQSIDRQGVGPDLALLERVGAAGLSTPLIYAGGIRTVEQAVQAVRAGADRVAIDALLHDDPDMAARLSEPLGAQAIVAVLPVSMSDGEIGWFDYRERMTKPFSPELLEVLGSGAISEAVVVDHRHDGTPASFDAELIDRIASDVPLIAFGGISEPEQVRALLDRTNVVAVGIGNFLSYREHAIQSLRNAADSAALRPPLYDQPLAIA